MVGSRRRRVVLRTVAVMAAAMAMLPFALSPSAAASSGGATSRYMLLGQAPAGSALLANYGGASLVDLTATQAAAATAAGAQLELVPDVHSLKLMRGTIDTSAGLPSLPAALRAPAAPSSWIVQFVGPPADGWYDALEAAGFHRVAHGYVPENGW